MITDRRRVHCADQFVQDHYPRKEQSGVTTQQTFGMQCLDYLAGKINSVTIDLVTL
jgi:hypothetical protein